MTTEDRRVSQRDALDAFAAIQQPRIPLSTIAPLQMQLEQAQVGRLHTASASAGETSRDIVSEQYLVFSIDDYTLAVKAELVQGVERIVSLTPVPNVAPWIKGVMNLRGSIVSVVDLRMFLGLEPSPYTARTRLLSLQYNEMVICLVVDGVSEMLPIPSAGINGDTRHAEATHSVLARSTQFIVPNSQKSAIPQWATPYAAGSTLLGNRVVVLLDVARLLFSDKMQHY